MTITIRILTHIYCFIVKTGFGATQTAENPLEMASTWSWSESFPCLTAGQRNGDSEDEIDCICLVCFITNTASRRRSQDKPTYFFTWLRVAKKILQITVKMYYYKNFVITRRNSTSMRETREAMTKIRHKPTLLSKCNCLRPQAPILIRRLSKIFPSVFALTFSEKLWLSNEIADECRCDQD